MADCSGASPALSARPGNSASYGPGNRSDGAVAAQVRIADRMQSPVSAAMHEVYALLGCQPGEAGGADAGGFRSGFFYDVVNVPPLNRGSMGARRNWHRSWIVQFKSLFHRSPEDQGRTSRSLVLFFMIFFSLMALFLMVAPN